MERFFVGIDPAAEQFVAAVFETASHKVQAWRRFDAADAVEAFSGWLLPQGVAAEEALLCLENTGVYCERLPYALYGRGFRLVVLEPYKVWKAFADGPKTDQIDSGRLAEYGFRYRDKLALWQPNQAIAEQIKILLSTREQLVAQKTAAAAGRSSRRRLPHRWPLRRSARRSRRCASRSGRWKQRSSA